MAGRAPALLLLYLFLSLLVQALPAVNPSTPSQPKSSSSSTPSLSGFAILDPKPNTVWLTESLPTVAWDKSPFPEGATVDIALLHRERKESTLLRRYVPARIGSTMVNLRPDLRPGTYALLITVFKDRSTTVLARSLVQTITVVVDDNDDEKVDTTTTSSSASSPSDNNNNNDKDDDDAEKTLSVIGSSSTLYAHEQLALNYQPKNSVVVRAPYTLGWTIPAPLKRAKHAKVDILLVDDKTTDDVVAVVATRMNAHAGFTYVNLPDTVPRGRYRLKIEMYGKGRRFVGYTSNFNVRESAMSPRNVRKA
ncbi:hypothetical protein DFQ26_005238 [Actinomortierella ambigua]|nr:hypothetical protein DFQ26_005238 [Actinomortierella ambigua]